MFWLKWISRSFANVAGVIPFSLLFFPSVFFVFLVPAFGFDFDLTFAFAVSLTAFVRSLSISGIVWNYAPLVQFAVC